MEQLTQILAWSDPLLTGVIFGAGLIFLVSNIFLSFLSSSAYFTLGLVLTGLASKIYVHLMGFLKKPCSDPLAWLEKFDVNIPSERTEETVKLVVAIVVDSIPVIKSLLLAHNFANSAKFAGVLYCITYVGAFLNTLTLLISIWVATFILPFLYNQNKELLEELTLQARTHYKELSERLVRLVNSNSVNMVKEQ